MLKLYNYWAFALFTQRYYPSICLKINTAGRIHDPDKANTHAIKHNLTTRVNSVCLVNTRPTTKTGAHTEHADAKHEGLQTQDSLTVRWTWQATAISHAVKGLRIYIHFIII